MRKLDDDYLAALRLAQPAGRLTYDDGMTAPDEQGKPAALYLDQRWVGDLDIAQLPRAGRDALGMLFAAAPSLLDEVLELRKALTAVKVPQGETSHRVTLFLERVAELYASEADRDTLARILAVEQGDESQAPDGWATEETGWWVDASGSAHIQPADIVDSQELAAAAGLSFSRGEVPETTRYFYQWDVDSVAAGWAPTALEAMEAADKAKEADNGPA